MGEPRLRREDNRRRQEEDEEEGLVSDPTDFGPSRTDRAEFSLATTRGYSDAKTTRKPSTPGGGGVYIPPAKRRQMLLEQQQDAAQQLVPTKERSSAIQQQTWNDQKRVIHGTINRLNESTIKPLIHDLFRKVNLLRLRGILAKHLLQAALTSTQYSAVYAALVAVLNTKLPEVGELVLKRSILSFRRHYRRREKSQCLAMAVFMGHLFHQAVVHELLILQILTLLLDGDPTDDSVEVAVEFLTVVGQALLEVSPAGVRAVLDRLRSLLHEGHLQKRVEYKMEVLLKMRKTGFRECPAPIPEELDLVERDDQITFELSLDDEDLTKDENLDVFHADDDYEDNEETWAKIRAEILGLGGDSDGDGDDETDDDDDDEGEEEEDETPDQELVVLPSNSKAITTIQDLTEADLVHLRRQIYLTIMSSATFEECTHKLTQISIPPGRECELINMIIECCSQERTFLRYYGLIGARFCLLDNRWLGAFLEAFTTQYTTIHRLETNKLRNVAKLFAHLLHTDSMPWKCLSIIHLNEDETTSSSRIFVKILIQEMAEAMGIAKLKERFETTDPEMSQWYSGMFPHDDVRKTRYAINFFTSIGLGPLTDGLREFLKNAPKMILAQAAAEAAAREAKAGDDESVSSTSSSSTSSSDSSSFSSSSSYTSSSSYDSSNSTSSSSSYSSDSSSSSYSRSRRNRRRRSPSPTSTDSDSDDAYDRRKSDRKRKDADGKNDRDSTRQDRNRPKEGDSENRSKRAPRSPDSDVEKDSPSKSGRDAVVFKESSRVRVSDNRSGAEPPNKDDEGSSRGRSFDDDRRKRKDEGGDLQDGGGRIRPGDDKQQETKTLDGRGRGREDGDSDRREGKDKRSRDSSIQNDAKSGGKGSRREGEGRRRGDSRRDSSVSRENSVDRVDRRSSRSDSTDDDSRRRPSSSASRHRSRSNEDRRDDRKRRRSPSSSSSSTSSSDSEDSRRNRPKRRRSASSADESSR
ncbi:Domain in DAP-5 [Fragilaria crotonensis]|nr:Domain in DAP-5 [Fragilaria crotonensis]